MKNTVIKGLLIGLVVPFLGYFLVSGVFEILVDMGIMDAASSSIASRRTRTTALIAICFNIFSLQFFRKRSDGPVVRGIGCATMIYAATWVYMFLDSLFV